ncbi:hypothetical protein [Poritiphilus flavus]|uniref:Uncharacterized protein n=1 Tax=Poritiphilus flavus TaxID=2697053 RepID=A0A6L9EGI4_9FLAO|nr:hypothetical protein [Poritiphilus flavus]NAS13845.1 hypothetical protein [Poritiphilus flavus]
MTGLIIGTIGLIAGILLIVSGQTLVGAAGSVASGGLALKGFLDSRKSE